MHVFISHSRVNSSAALLLCDQLLKHNIDTWLDMRDLEPGAEWEPAVTAAIRSAGGFVFLIGPPGPADRWQNFEWQQVVNDEYYLDPAKPLVPVLIGSPELPGFLRTRQAIVLKDTPGAFEQAAENIARALANPAASVDEAKLELGREARKRALETLRDYSQTLAEEDIKRVPTRAIK
ncbi:MAG: toll/interleukin-1 receptor domain-containing protein [Acidobacteriaceae bacterium]|nr:toll/interleukin-1 receptor domain-containing protein [Acidobacteriaceae bacterium]